MQWMPICLPTGSMPLLCHQPVTGLVSLFPSAKPTNSSMLISPCFHMWRLENSKSVHPLTPSHLLWTTMWISSTPPWSEHTIMTEYISWNWIGMNYSFIVGNGQLPVISSPLKVNGTAVQHNSPKPAAGTDVPASCTLTITPADEPGILVWLDTLPFLHFSISTPMLIYHDARNRRDASCELREPPRSRECSVLDFH